MSETFKLKLVKQEPHKLKQVVGLFNVLDGAIYKGAYLTTAELLAVEAAEHDYADNFETNTRWTHTLYEWVDTGTQIPDDARYVQLKDESVTATPNTVVVRDDNGEIRTAEPTNDDSAATKLYVDAEQTRAESAEQTLQANINAETQRATTSENALAESIAKETTDRQDADNALTKQIEAETTRAKNAESALQATIEATGSQLDQLIIDETKRAQNAEGILADAIDEEIARAKAAEQTKIDKTLTSSIVESVEYTYDDATDASALSVKSINPSTNTETMTNVQLIKANENQSGLMSKENVALLSQLNTRVASLEGRQYLYLYTASANPTADDINAFVLAQGGVSPFSGVEVLVEQTKHVWRYYENDNIGWRDDGIDTVQQATQTELGVVKGSATDGKVYVESDGTMSVMGYDALVESDSQNAQAIVNETTARQDADATLQTRINAEKTRAQNAENALNAALSQEISDRQNADTAITESVDAHIANKSNPHSVTKAQVGLSDVQNVDTTNANNISTGTLNALRLAATLLNAGENVTISRNAETGEFTISAAFTGILPVANGGTGADDLMDIKVGDSAHADAADTANDPNAVHFTEQTLTDEQKLQARKNISAAAEEQALKNMYNLGAYDTYVDNGDGTATITRKTYTVLDYASLDWYFGTTTGEGGDAFYCGLAGNFDDSDLTKLIISNTSRITVENGNANYTTRLTNGGGVQIVLPTSITNGSADALRAYLNEGGNIIAQMPLATSYTEDVILDQPINTLDVNGEQFVRNEWEKGLNLAPILDDGPYSLSAGNERWVVKNITQYTEPNKTYTISCKGVTFSNGLDVQIIRRYNDGRNIYKSFQNSVTFTMTGVNVVEVRLGGNTLTASMSITPKIMLVEGNHAYPYQPYNGAIVHEKELENYLPLSGGTMSGDIKMAGNSIVLRDTAKISHQSTGNVTNLENSNFNVPDGQVSEQGQRVYSPNNPPPVAAPYVTNLSTSSWSGSAGNYTYTISAATHGKGAYPSVYTYVSNEETYDSPTVDSSGNVTLHSNARVAMRVVIK